MEKHTCKLCSRRFSNGRALGGHMRSHLVNTTTTKQPPPPSPLDHQQHQHTSPLSSSYSGGPAEEEKRHHPMGNMGSYRLRENPKKSFKLSDPEFSDYGVLFSTSGNSSSMIVQDGESDTEEFTKQLNSNPGRIPTSRRRHRRRRLDLYHEPLLSSSVSDASPDEDVALSLMMLSRDSWPLLPPPLHPDDDDDDDDDDEDEEEEEEYYYQSDESERGMAVGTRKAGRSRHECGTCGKVFRSYQALGGHRANHKKVKHHHYYEPKEKEQGRSSDGYQEVEEDDLKNKSQLHRCPFCPRVFASGQALGGHKRSHLISSSSSAAAASTRVRASTSVAADASIGELSGRNGDSFIDLNLPPAPTEEVSALSDTGGN